MITHPARFHVTFVVFTPSVRPLWNDRLSATSTVRRACCTAVNPQATACAGRIDDTTPPTRDGVVCAFRAEDV
ncbi:hypothetical protein JOF55_004782 [Haloactinomyces albus]|uniref:Uncharacterized protein n=1 Tax=Haloactinomyces albus TaxID=1352928 RepID=A0AAE3ZJ24_9ACTN|nr:hypothetical protein [Haloactinomyces albus]